MSYKLIGKHFSVFCSSFVEGETKPFVSSMFSVYSMFYHQNEEKTSGKNAYQICCILKQDPAGHASVY